MLNVTSFPHSENHPDKQTVVRRNWIAGFSRNAIVPLGLIAFSMLLMSQTGCSSRARGLGNSISESLMVEYRDAIWSRRAYNIRYGNCDRPFGNHYRDGFCAGYQDVCNGGDGYVPALPPTEYRGYEYQCADGAKCVNTWFEGYPAGVAAAKKDRSGDFQDMFISRMVNSAVIQDKAKHVLPGDVPIITPDAKSNRKDAASQGRSQLQTEAPPAPQKLSRQPAIGSGVDQPHPITAAAFVSEQISVMDTATQPAMPPIVSSRPSDNSPIPMVINRQARISNGVPIRTTR